MRFLLAPITGHPSQEVLSLLARNDLSLLTRLRLQRHVAQCAACEHQVALFAAANAELKREAASETLTSFEAVADWNRLEREMLGNIAVGVAAARCIEKVGPKHTWLLRTAVAAGFGALFAGGWVTHIPPRQTANLIHSFGRFVGMERPVILESVVQTTSGAIAVRSQGITLTFPHPASALVSVSGSSSLEARYIDENTGQLTITNVYGQ